jgi:hypothetical protein
MVSVIVVTASIDTSLTRISVFSPGLNSYPANVAFFAFLVIVYAIGQFIILRNVRVRNVDSRYRDLNLMNKLVNVTQYLLLALLVTIVLQMFLALGYSIMLLKGVFWINYAISIILVGLFSFKLFLWFRSNRSSVVIAYAIAMSAICLNSVFTVLYVSNELTGQRGVEWVQPLKSLVSIVTETNKALNSGFVGTSILSFILTWFATVLLLRHYSVKLGPVKYWIIVSIPLVFFLTQFQSLIINLLAPIRASDPILFGIVYTLTFGGAKTAGGILFGIAFWSVARNVKQRLVKDYMIISAYGLVLLYASNQPLGLTLVPFPPFGLITISFYGLSSYLVYLGVYTSALSVANDTELRRSVKKTLRTHSDLLSSIGSAQVQRQVEATVVNATKKLSTQLTNETGVESSFLEENEIKEYINKVIEEIQSDK